MCINENHKEGGICDWTKNRNFEGDTTETVRETAREMPFYRGTRKQRLFRRDKETETVQEGQGNRDCSGGTGETERETKYS